MALGHRLAPLWPGPAVAVAAAAAGVPVAGGTPVVAVVAEVVVVLPGAAAAVWPLLGPLKGGRGFFVHLGSGGMRSLILRVVGVA